MVAADATSVEDMGAMFKSLDGMTLGGVMMLSGILIDRLFPRQDEDSFNQAFGAKVGATRTLEKVIDIKSLDWLIAFTSISGFFGSAGQVCTLPFALSGCLLTT
jgi:hypothetical protein